jgi:5-carboxymethyl-2-hydroxymuconate isomerase
MPHLTLDWSFHIRSELRLSVRDRLLLNSPLLCVCTVRSQALRVDLFRGSYTEI